MFMTSCLGQFNLPFSAGSSDATALPKKDHSSIQTCIEDFLTKSTSLQIGPLNTFMDFHLKGHPYVKSPIDMACWDILGKVPCIKHRVFVNGSCEPTFRQSQAILTTEDRHRQDVGQWLWLSWQSGCFQFQRSAVRIPSSAKIYIEYFTVNCIEKTKIKKKRPGKAHLKKIFYVASKKSFEQNLFRNKRNERSGKM